MDRINIPCNLLKAERSLVEFESGASAGILGLSGKETTLSDNFIN